MGNGLHDKKKKCATTYALRLALALALLSNSFSLGEGGEASADESDATPFVISPYIQLGNNPTYDKLDNLELLWVTKDIEGDWSVEIKRDGQSSWTKAPPAKHREIIKSDDGSNSLFDCALKGLPVNKKFEYRVNHNDKVVFSSTSQARKSKDQPYSFDVFGDMGSGSDGQRKIANLCFQSKPDFIINPGDLVYYRGLFSEYLTNYFPIFNADTASAQGVPLIRSTLTIGVLGNHDIATTSFFGPANFDKYPGALAFYYLWSEPLNGPKEEGAFGTPPVAGAAERQTFFKQAAGANFPGMGNYSFDYGNSHWTVLDGNYYTAWGDPLQRKWVADDLKKAKKSTWRFVTFHQPGFSTDTQHSKEQRMRMLSDIFQEGKVDIVFSGHAHDYQRTFPILFEPKIQNGRPYQNPDGTVDGTIKLDKEFDGEKITSPKGIIYIVTGAGGAILYKSLPGAITAAMMDFTDKFDAKHFSLSSCHVTGKKFEMQQLAEDGTVLDKFIVEKP